MCGKGFAKSGSLTKHKLNKSGANPFYCDLGDKKFTQSGSLNTHCYMCDKGFTKSGH